MPNRNNTVTGQANRPLTVTTRLGADVLLLTGFTGHEALSQLFNFQVDVQAEDNRAITFDRLLGQSITINLSLPDGTRRYFSGICNRVSEGERRDRFTPYRLQMVPQLWLLTKRAQSRIFQHLSVPDILRQVFEGLDVAYQLQGTFHPRDFCVQYRETDFYFASRLMEEEGIYYFFQHTANGHRMVVANTPQSHPDMPFQSRVIYENQLGGLRDEDRIYDWEKSQELRAGKYTLWDHCFELPHSHLEATKTILDSVQAGSVHHRLRMNGSDRLEIYDWPGEFAQRHDGVDRGGGDRAGNLQRVYEDNRRTVEIRMQEEAVSSLVIRGASNCRHFVSGHKFTLERHGNGNGEYVLTDVQHSAQLSGNYVSNSGGSFQYHNSFTCIPHGLPFRPPRMTPKPFVQGSQTAVVVGPAGEEIFTDKYGRVKVQFHWDRQGRNNGDSSCWIRVATPWAGKRWGAVHIPRVGQEVVVDFQEGDPDQPIIIGSVYNAEMMPPYALPEHKTRSGVKTRSSARGSADNFNELRFEDKKGEEEVYFHAEKDFHRVVENDDDLKVGHDQRIEVQNHRAATVKDGDDKLTLEKGNREVTLELGNGTLRIKTGNQTTKVDLGKSETEAMQSIELKVGQSSIKLDQTGVTIKGLTVTVEGQAQTQVKGLMTQISADAMLQVKGGVTMIG